MTRLIEYIQGLNESVLDKGIFKSVFMSGSSASGKSYVLTKITSGQIQPRIVNTDTWTEYYMKFLNSDPKEFWPEYGKKIKTLSQSQLANYINSLLPMWIDGTSSNSSATLRRKGILQSLGYDTAMVFVDTPVETSIKRNKERNREVPEEFLRKAYEDSQKLKNYYSSEFRNFTEILNGEGELTDKVIIDAYKKVEKFYLSPIENPIGKELKEEMIENGWKYLVDTPEYDMGYIKKLINSWYKKG